VAGRQPEEAVRQPVVHQGWRHLSFLHWSYDPDVIAALLPDGLEVDTFDGRAWVGLTPFLVTGFRPALLPAIPGLSTFPETNLRTYVRDKSGRDGLWFLSLEVDSVATTVGARIGYGVPYHWAAMSVDCPDLVTYRSKRRSGDATHDIAVRPGEALAEPSAFEDWLTGRWRAFTHHAGRLFDVPVRHEPWPLQAAAVVRLDETLRAAAGLPPCDEAPLVHFSPGVTAHLGPPRSVRR
jgi:uncharacterized protein YqjF (DUF2071 family)